MTVLGTTDVPLDLFGGIVTDMSPPDLPFGVSPDCQDVAFLNGAVKTRPGLLSVFSPIAGNPTINYLKTYIGPNLAETLLALDSSGSLWGETSPGTLASIASGIAPNSRGASSTLFGREYIAFGDGKFGIDVPRQYDGTNFDRVSQCGVGGWPSGAAASDVIANITSISRASNVVTVVTATPHGIIPADQVVIAGVTTIAPVSIATIERASGIVTLTASAAIVLAAGAEILVAGVAGGTTSFNGTFTLLSVDSTQTIFTFSQQGADEAGTGGTAGIPSDLNGTFAVASVTSSTQVSYAQIGADETGVGGTANPLGSLTPGVHQVAVAFLTRQGYITPPSPAISWTSLGNCRAQIANIPIPLALSNIVARILMFTAAGGDSFYYTTGTDGSPQMQINDTTTETWVVDFSDSDLLAGTLADPLFNLVELGESAGVIGYSDRLFWWGERNKQNNWQNLTFDGGFDPSGGAPLGWTPDATFFAGGQRDFGVWGGAYDIIGDGATATRGLITQSAVSDTDGVPRIANFTAYSVRARVKAYGAPTRGTLHVHLYSASGGINTAGLQVTAAQVTSSWQEFIATLTAPLSTIPSDLVLRVFADGTPPAGNGFIVDNIEIFPTAEPYNTGVVRCSQAGNPESYDGVSGLLEVAPGDGTCIRSAFELRGILYFVKERSLYSTQDDGVNEPANWTVNEISRVVGTPSVNGVDVGEDWAVIAARQGLYIYDGSEPVKISQEIQPLWDSVNWDYGHTIWVRVDTRNRRILCGVPIGAATSPSRVLVLDYRSCYTADEIESLGPYHFSTYSGKLFAAGRARRWCPWNIVANCATLAERADGTAQLFVGNGIVSGAGNGKIYELSDAQLSDDGAAINSYYTTFFFLSNDLEQQYEVRSHRKLFSYLTLYAEGSGALSISAFAVNEAYPTALPPLSLYSPGPKDLELPINVIGERVAFQVGTNAPGSWFRLERFTPSLLPDPWAPVRGVN
ncbi:MAG: hypothetical protein ACLP1Y_12105 [Candidatus Acidiferrales bacterium]